MRLMLKVLVVVLLASCEQQHPQRQQKISDAELQRWRTDMPGMKQECLEKMKWGGIEALPKNSDDCFQFTQPMRMRGLWRNDFEGSEYCDGPVSNCPDGRAEADPRS